MASTKKGAAVPALEDGADASAIADAQAATIEAARIVREQQAADHATALGNAIVNKLTALAGDAIVVKAFSFEEARQRTLAIIRALQTGSDLVTEAGELDGLAAALEAAAPPPPVHEDTCQTFAFAKAQAAFKERGMSDELIEAVSGHIPSACNCKASKPKRGAVAAHPRSTPVSTLPAGVLPVQYTKLDGTTVPMRYSDAARQAATDYPAAVACAKYVKGVDGIGGPKQSLNAQLPLREDAKAGNIPAIAIRFMADPAADAAEPVVETKVEAVA